MEKHRLRNMRLAMTILLAVAVGCDEKAHEDDPWGSTTQPAGNLSLLPPPASDATRSATPSRLQLYTYRQIHMAMPVEISLWATSPEQAESAAKAAFAQVARIDRLMNDYVGDTEISYLNQQGGHDEVHVSDETWTVLLAARRMHQLTGGAFDPTAAPVVALWREAQKTGSLPESEQLSDARRIVGMDKLRLNEAARTVRLPARGMRLDFGGIAKGYACDLATEALRRHGLSITFVQAGGDMVLGDPPPGADGWEIDIPGQPTMMLANTAASISGDTERFVIIDGVRYSHVVDPRTGMAVTSRQMAVVLGPRGIDTDPLSTAGCVMEVREFEKLIKSLEGYSARVFTAPAE